MAVHRLVLEEARLLSLRCGSSPVQHVQPKWMVYRVCHHGAAGMDLMVGWPCREQKSWLSPGLI